MVGGSAFEERVFELWVSKPSHWRYEVRTGHKEGTLKIIKGDLWWLYDPQSGATTNERSSVPELTQSPIEEDLSMFNPLWPINELRMEVVANTHQCNREAIQVRGTPWDTRVESRWPGAKEYQLIIDLETGVLLRSAALIDGTEFAVSEMLEVEFDGHLGDDIFEFLVPPGVTIEYIE
jgi:outer membrane lipoprotein-sorting protein